jgi:dihydroxyacetone kinase-like protein
MEVAGVMSCDRAKLLRIIGRMADVIAAEKEHLTELDARIGDADHGVNLNRGFEAVRTKLPALAETCIGTILKTVGMTLLSTVGGASGPLYGTAFMDAGMRLMGKETINRADLTIIFQAALAGIQRRGKANSGEKTMVDTLTPVVDYLNDVVATTDLDWGLLKNEILIRAKQGMESTLPLQATKGRASFLQERSMGHLDPGAVSCYLLIKTGLETD